MTTGSGYSGKPLAAKLGYRAGSVACVQGAPTDYTALLGELPPDVRFVHDAEAGVDLFHVFTASASELAHWLQALNAAMSASAMLWVSWPKKASRVPTDLTEDRIRALALPLGLVDVKVCAVDSVWSGLKLVRRKALR